METSPLNCSTLWAARPIVSRTPAGGHLSSWRPGGHKASPLPLAAGGSSNQIKTQALAWVESSPESEEGDKPTPQQASGGWAARSQWTCPTTAGTGRIHTEPKQLSAVLLGGVTTYFP